MPGCNAATLVPPLESRARRSRCSRPTGSVDYYVFHSDGEPAVPLINALRVA